MSAYKYPELAKRFSDQVPDTVKEMMRRVTTLLGPKRHIKARNLRKEKRKNPARKVPMFFLMTGRPAVLTETNGGMIAEATFGRGSSITLVLH